MCLGARHTMKSVPAFPEGQPHEGAANLAGYTDRLFRVSRRASHHARSRTLSRKPRLSQTPAVANPGCRKPRLSQTPAVANPGCRKTRLSQTPAVANPGCGKPRLPTKP